jgi:hypothetical protein
MDVIITSAEPNNVTITCDKPNIIYVVGAQPVNVTISFNIPNQTSSQSLKQTLLNGNETDGENIVVNDDDAIQLENNSLLKKGTYDFGGNGGISRICGVGFEDMWQSGIRHVFDSNGFIRNSTNCFDIVPNETFDETLRFKVGSIWTLDDGSSYICTDASLGTSVWESFNLTATDIDALKRDGSNANQDIDLGVYSIKVREIVTQTNGQGKGMSLRSSNLTSEKFAEWQDKDYTGIADLQDVVDAILALKDGVDLSGDTLQKLYNLILGATAEAYVADIAERDAYDIQRLPFSIFVIDDGDGKWAKYQATTTGIGANFVKLSDPDLLNAVMSASAIKAAYESNSDTNAFTNALKTKLEGIDLSQYLLVSNISNILTGTSTTKALSEAQGKALKDLVDTKQQTITDVILAQIISSLNSKTALANNDFFPIYDTATGATTAKRVSFTSLKSFLKTYFDTLYQTALGFNAENIANKQNSLAADGSGVKYPTVDAVFYALALKVDKEIGKVLSTNDFTNILKTKLDGIADGAEVNVNPDWNATSGDAQILNKPSIITPNLNEVLTEDNQTNGKNIFINNADSIELENTSSLKKGTYNFGGNGGISRICSNNYEDMWQDGFRHVFDQSGFIRTSSNGFDTVPNSSFDVTLRFKVGSFWTLDNGTTYICTDNTEGAAVWELYSIGSTPTLQQVTDKGSETTQAIKVKDSEKSATFQSNSINFKDLELNGSTLLRFVPTNVLDQEIQIRGLSGTMALTSDITTPTLQQVTDEGNVTTNAITVGSLTNNFSQIGNNYVSTQNVTEGTYAYIDSFGFLSLGKGNVEGEDPIECSLYIRNVTEQIGLEFPDKPTGTYTIATTEDITGSGVTSVGLTMPSAFSVTNSPITSSGDIAVTGAGLVSQYIRGDGTLANFPSSIGGGSSVNYYLNGSVSQGTFGGTTYYQMSKTPILGAGTNFTRTNGAGNGYIASFITDAGDPSFLNIPGGNWNLEFYFQSSSTGGSPQFYGEIYKVSATNTFTLVASGSTNPEGITNGTTVDQYFTSISVPQTSLLVTDRLAVRIYVITSGRTITLHTENGNLCEVLTTFTTGLTALNGLTQQVQYFDEGTSGTDFNISSATDTHTFNLPTASATNRGALSSTDWSTFNNKQNSSTRRNANNSSNNNINYCGVALGTGVSESATVWTITRLTITASGSITITTATNVAWTNRESVIY